ncbi:MAG TPA: ABC transporter ATP-binding protein [Tepidisphaeraceae bacterium]|jgi:ATP-binding cassette subfamily B protein/subfamily B ATP-binding cassette protein MsbA|nr:ABC transporter ATP-binding protein [Tepidisphaeraceae bacterium]
MPQNSRSSHRRYDQYKQDAQQRRTQGLDKNLPPMGGPGDRKSKSTKRLRGAFELFRLFWGLLREHRPYILGALATVTLSTTLGLIPLYGTKLVFDNVLDTKPLPHFLPSFIHDLAGPRQLLAVVAVTMVVISLISVIVNMWGRWQSTRIMKRVSVDMRRRLFAHTVRLPLHRVYALKSGGVSSILRDDAGGAGDLVFSMIYNPWRAIVQIFGTLIILSFVEWRLLLGSLLLFPTVWLTHKTWVGRIRPVWRDIRFTRQNVDSQATESFAGMRVVRSFGRQKFETTQFITGNHLMTRQELLAWWWARGIDAAWSILIPLASAILLWYGGSKVLHDQALVRAHQLPLKDALTTGSLVMFLGYLTALLGPIASLAESATNLQNNLAGFDRTLDILAEPIEMPNRPGARVLSKENVQGRLSLQNVSFAYPKDKKKGDTATSSSPSPKENNGDASHFSSPVLSGINLEVAAGETIALVGPSGAGKTTLCNLIARFYDPTAGSISLDGVDLRDIDVDSYRRLLGIVEQDTFLFDGSIADNIAYGRRDATLAEIIHAAELANAHSFITQLDNGYDTLIGERGVKLSGGQRQRLTIARAILADPKILILDEATSNLDTESERLIQGSLHQLMQNRTSFVIAHRLSTVAGADRILVIENGHIAEQGTHTELMARSGRYRTMVELQTHPHQLPHREEKKVLTH